MSSSKLNKKKSSKTPKRSISSQISLKRLKLVLLVLFVVGSGALAYYQIPFMRTEVVKSEIPFNTEYIDDSSLELGQEQTRQNGEIGTKETVYSIKRTLSGREIERTISSENTVKYPVQKTIAKGTKKYQFMWCSNGAYRYYSSDEFKNPSTGFTHQSVDFCAQNGQGHMTGLADTAPPQQTRNVYQQSSPTITNCYDTGIYTSSFSCYSY